MCTVLPCSSHRGATPDSNLWVTATRLVCPPFLLRTQGVAAKARAGQSNVKGRQQCCASSGEHSEQSREEHNTRLQSYYGMLKTFLSCTSSRRSSLVSCRQRAMQKQKARGDEQGSKQPRGVKRACYGQAVCVPLSRLSYVCVTINSRGSSAIPTINLSKNKFWQTKKIYMVDQYISWMHWLKQGAVHGKSTSRDYHMTRNICVKKTCNGAPQKNTELRVPPWCLSQQSTRAPHTHTFTPGCGSGP